MSNASDFIIENGILKEYVGPGGDVVIPEGVTSIGNKAFWLSHVVCVVIPDSVTSIETRAFEYCELLQKVVMSKNINEIGIGIFNECRALSNIQIPNGVKKIWWNAFSYCSSLSHITIPDSVESIENGAFLGCDSLKIHITDISILPSGIRRNAAICFLEDGGDPLDPRSSSHYKFIKSNAGRMMDQMIANPEMLVVMLREKMLTPKNALAYLDAAQAAGNAEAIALMLDYNTNNLTSAEKKRVEK